jgi:hypothetical protein
MFDRNNVGAQVDLGRVDAETFADLLLDAWECKAPRRLREG